MGGQDGLAEIVVVLVFAAIIGFAFLWALVLHDKPTDERTTTTVFDPTATTLVPPTLPPARKYEVDGGVNLREGPATNTPVLAKLEDGAKVRVICKTVGQSITSEDGSTDLWVRIDLGQFGVGYASALYVDTGDDIEDAAIIGDCALAPTG
jgi:uncharacterized protein YraI